MEMSVTTRPNGIPPAISPLTPSTDALPGASKFHF